MIKNSECPQRRGLWKARRFLAVALALSSSQLLAQFEVGRTTIAFVDASRNNRVVSTRIKYPASMAGMDVAPAPGQFPVVAWAHGLTVGVGSYAPLWEALVPAGYVVVLPRTEGGGGANALELGRDLAFVIAAMHAEQADPASLFFQAIDTNVSAIGGHSMGGGAATLGAAENPWINTLITMAAFETNPSPISAAANVFMPALVIGGTNDCVTPIAFHQRPMYEAMSSECKYLVELIDGTHCGFLAAGSNCDNFEGGCPTDPPQLDQQLAQMLALTLPWLDAHVLQNSSGLSQFQSVLATDPNLMWEGGCDSFTYCHSNPNSTGLTAVLSASGSTAIADNALLLTTTLLPTGQPGYYLMAQAQGFVPLFGGSSGNLCLASPIVRFATSLLDSGPSGIMVFTPDLTQLPQGVIFLPGDTWNFQCWFRDVSGTSNTSNGLTIHFQ